MSDPFIGQLMIWTSFRIPSGWAICDGRQLQIAQYTALYTILGTKFGGDGVTNFCLPNLSNAFIMGQSPDHPYGSTGGSTTASVTGSASGSITLDAANLPAHSHGATFTGIASTANVNTIISVLQGTGSPSAVAGGNFSQGPGSGSGAASIFVPPNTSGTYVPLSGGASTVSLTPTGTVSVDQTGSGQPYSLNVPVTGTATVVPPFLSMYYIIALEGIFPRFD